MVSEDATVAEIRPLYLSGVHLGKCPRGGGGGGGGVNAPPPPPK